MFCLFISQAHSADIEWRPDLREHIFDLRLIYSQSYSAERDQSILFFHDLERSEEVRIAHLSGIIKKGDSRKLERLLKESGFSPTLLVFNSPGGSFSEGVKIGEVLQGMMEGNGSEFRGVYVLNGSECLSACAVAFAMATLTRHEAQWGPFMGRFIEDGARVGFHMGILPDDLASQSAPIGQTLNIAYDVVASLARITELDLNPARLLTEMLKHRTADSFFEFSGDAVANSLGFQPVTTGLLANPLLASGLNAQTALFLCGYKILFSHSDNSQYTSEYLAYKDGYARSQSDFFSKLKDLTNANVFAEHFEGGDVCYITITSDNKVLIDTTTPGALRECIVRSEGPHSEQWCASPARPNSELVTIGMLADTYFCAGGVFLSNHNGSGVGPVRSVATHDVNIRSQPSLTSAKIGRLNAGEQVNIADCAIVEDSQGVWLKIEYGPQRSGWVSARFVNARPNWKLH